MVDMSEYLGEYVKEAEEHLDNLNSALLGLEKNPDNLELINEMFRSAHTLKSSSAAMGFDKISELAHNMEDALGRLKDKELKATSSIVDLLLDCFDVLEAMANQVKKGEKENRDIDPLIKELTKLMEIDSSKNFKYSGFEGKDSVEKITELRAVSYVKVDVSSLDKLMNLVGELLINKMRLKQVKLENNLGSLNESINQLNLLIADLQFEVMKIRMVPIGHVFKRFPRMVRDLAEKENKSVDFVMEGEDIELDRTILDKLGEPLVHLLRNAIDHGVESLEEREKKGKSKNGTLKLVARKDKNTVVIEIIDDGDGFDKERIREVAVAKGMFSKDTIKSVGEKELLMLPFKPQFSTAKKVTDVSGRGVGLDVVKTKIEELNGKVGIKSEEGKGTKFILELPLTLAIIQCFLVQVGKDYYGIPLTNVIRSVRLRMEDIKTIAGFETFLFDGEDISLSRVSDLFHFDYVQGVVGDNLTVVVVETANEKVGLVVNKIIGEQELIIKPLDKSLKNTKGLSGATILGDGSVILILDLNTLF